MDGWMGGGGRGHLCNCDWFISPRGQGPDRCCEGVTNVCGGSMVWGSSCHPGVQGSTPQCTGCVVPSCRGPVPGEGGWEEGERWLLEDVLNGRWIVVRESDLGEAGSKKGQGGEIRRGQRGWSKEGQGGWSKEGAGRVE